MNITPLILIVDDRPENLFLLRAILKNVNCDVIEASSEEIALELANKMLFSCILLDVQMPNMNGFTLAKKLNAIQVFDQGPILFITASDRCDEKIIEGYRCGAIDYLFKPFVPEILISKVNILLELYTHKKNAEHALLTQEKMSLELKQLAYYDPLTELFNRRQFWFNMERIEKESKRNQEKFAVYLLDIDGFKNINDTLGHDVGDLLLIEISKRIKKSVRSSEVVSRMGGDEFTVIVPRITEVESTEIIAKQLISNISKEYKLGNIIVKITTSIGIAIYPVAGTEINDLFKKADIALYRAKHKGKNTFRYYSETLNIEYQRKTFIQTILRQSLQNEEFYLLYQPIMDLETSKIKGVESLIRWNNAELGLLLPSEFIPIAEKSNLMDEIGLWVIETSCKAYVRWREVLQNKAFLLSINISPSQLHNKNFEFNLEAIFERYAIEKSNIILELTETYFEEQNSNIEGPLDRLYKKGYPIALDDFGTGYSSFSRLTTLPIKILKIDRSFICKIGKSKKHEALIKLTLDLAKSLQLKVIIEGIETKTQIDFIKELSHLKQQAGILTQGFYYHEAISASEVHSILKKDDKAEESNH